MMNEDYLQHNKRYIVGVSGGCDSMCLLDQLRIKGYQIFVAHVNYNLRRDTQEDYEVVSEYCAQYGIPFYYKVFHPEDYHEGNFQETARNLRYDFYKELYALYQCDGVLLGHHLDDHIETIYMQLERKSQSSYLGIQSHIQIKGMQIIRPLLSVYKKDILNYCELHHISYHDDYTNFETEFTRDRVRNTVLNTYSLAQKEELLSIAKDYNQSMQEIEELIIPYYDRYKENGYISYQEIPNDLQGHFYYLILKDVMHPKLISHSLLEEIKKQLSSDKPNIQMNLPVNYLFIKEYDNVYILNKDYSKPYQYDFEHETNFSCEYFSLTKEGHINEGVYLSKDDYPITIRSFIPGDSIETSAGTKKVSRLFINAKIPTLQRKSWPILLNKDKKIILVPNIAKNIVYLSTKPNVFVIK